MSNKIVTKSSKILANKKKNTARMDCANILVFMLLINFYFPVFTHINV